MTGRVPNHPGTMWLTIGGGLSLAAAVLHVACIIGGPDWYRFFGAGEAMALAAEQGESGPALTTLGIVLILTSWSTYAFSGAGRILHLPLLRTALVIITAIYLLRALAPIPIAVFWPDKIDAFTLWSSAIVLVFGAVHAIGLWRGWTAMSPRIGHPASA
jgi:hypothetical protein